MEAATFSVKMLTNKKAQHFHGLSDRVSNRDVALEDEEIAEGDISPPLGTKTTDSSPLMIGIWILDLDGIGWSERPTYSPSTRHGPSMRHNKAPPIISWKIRYEFSDLTWESALGRTLLSETFIALDVLAVNLTRSLCAISVFRHWTDMMRVWQPMEEHSAYRVTAQTKTWSGFMWKNLSTKHNSAFFWLRNLQHSQVFVVQREEEHNVGIVSQKITRLIHHPLLLPCQLPSTVCS